MFIGVGGNVLVMLLWWGWCLLMLLLLLLLLGSTFHVDLRGRVFHGRRVGSAIGIIGTETREAHGTCLHVVTRHATRFGDDQSLLGLIHGAVGGCWWVLWVVHGRLSCPDEALDHGMSGVGTCLALQLVLSLPVLLQGGSTGEGLRRASGREASRRFCEMSAKGRARVRIGRGGSVWHGEGTSVRRRDGSR